MPGRTRRSAQHLVLGLLAEPEALAAKAIVARGVPLERVREAAVEEALIAAIAEAARR